MYPGSEADPIKRFSQRVSYYIQSRPAYPEAMLKFLKRKQILSSSSVIADVGSGTGILSEQFLQSRNRVFGVEPNAEIRRTAEELLKKYPRFTSMNGTAESTGLASHSIDIVAAGQAFHWFDIEKAKKEFRRILKTDGWVLLIWNTRQVETTPFLKAYEELLGKYGIDYSRVNHRKGNEERLDYFFGSGQYEVEKFENFQEFDYERLKARLLSSSYVPLPEHPDFEPMIQKLERIFQEYQARGNVTFEYDTELYYGNLKS